MRFGDAMSALSWGIILKHTAVVVEMLKKDQIDVNYQDDAGRTALMCAIEIGNGELSMALLDRKDINLTLENVREKVRWTMHENQISQRCWQRSDKSYM